MSAPYFILALMLTCVIDTCECGLKYPRKFIVD